MPGQSFRPRECIQRSLVDCEQLLCFYILDTQISENDVEEGLVRSTIGLHLRSRNGVGACNLPVQIPAQSNLARLQSLGGRGDCKPCLIGRKQAHRACLWFLKLFVLCFVLVFPFCAAQCEGETDIPSSKRGGNWVFDAMCLLE